MSREILVVICALLKRGEKALNTVVKIIIYGIAAVWIAWILHEIFIKEKTPKNNIEKKADHKKKLLTATLGDRDKRERLIKYELNRDNSIGYDEAAKRAIERLQRDRK